MESHALVDEIADYCRKHGLAESTFGRLAINDGKLMSRLRTGGRVTHETLERMQVFMRTVEQPLRRKPSSYANGHARVARLSMQAPGREAEAKFRLYDNRQKYLLFVTTCSEKWVVADRVGRELANIHPQAARGAPVRRRRRRRHDPHPCHARDASPLPGSAVPHRRQGDQPRRRAPDAGEDARPVLRASRDLPRHDQHELHRGAVAHAEIRRRGAVHGVARAGADRRHRARFRAPESPSSSPSCRRTGAPRSARARAIRSTRSPSRS